MNRSEFFTRAAQQCLERLDAASVTEQIDQALAGAGDDDSSTAAATAGRYRLTRENEW